MAEFHTIHIWHKNIGQYDIDRVFFYKFSCLFSIFAVAYEFTVDCTPVNVLFNGITDEDLVIHQ